MIQSLTCGISAKSILRATGLRSGRITRVTVVGTVESIAACVVGTDNPSREEIVKASVVGR